MADPEFARRLAGERLTTAEVLYYMPDHPVLLQRFMWQTLDISPDFPRIRRFLAFWRRDICAVIHSVTLSGSGLITPARLNVARDLGTLH